MQARALLAVLLLMAGRANAAAPGDVAAAEALFAQGKELMASNDFEHACPKLEESYRLDPATGALYAVALCHEAQGKLASAWGELMDVAARSSQERNVEREQSARRRAQMLEPRLPFLTVTLEPKLVDLPGLVVLRDGTP